MEKRPILRFSYSFQSETKDFETDDGWDTFDEDNYDEYSEDEFKKFEHDRQVHRLLSNPLLFCQGDPPIFFWQMKTGVLFIKALIKVCTSFS